MPLLSMLVLVLAAASASAQSSITPLLWKVTSPQGAVYLYGTVHVGAPDFYPLPKEVESAFNNSRVVALEADPSNQANLTSALAKAGYSAGQSIEQFIAPDLVDDLKRTLPALGVPFDSARRMKPYLLSMVMTVIELGRMGYDAQMGIDMHLAQRAKREGKALIELESMAAQLTLFDALAPDQQESMLRTTLQSMRTKELQTNLAQLIAAWRAGDEIRLMELVEHDMRDFAPSFRDEFKWVFYDKRNQEMANRIVAFLNDAQGPHFVAVGAGHLPGDTGIVALLRKQGYEITRVR